MPNFTVGPEAAAEAAARTNLLDDVPIMERANGLEGRDRWFGKSFFIGKL